MKLTRKKFTFIGRVFRHVNDNFRKVVITGNLHEKPWHDDNGIIFMGIMPFLLDPRSLETV